MHPNGFPTAFLATGILFAAAEELPQRQDTPGALHVLACHGPGHRGHVDAYVLRDLGHGQRSQIQRALVKELFLVCHDGLGHAEQRVLSLLNGIELIRVSFTDIAGKTPDVLTGKTIGKWMWTGPDPLVNDAKPGTYDATAHGAKATGSGGRATVHDGGTLGDPKGVKDDSFFTLGKIAELQGATSFAWTFEGLRLNRPGNHVLAGSIQNAFGPGSLFIITASAGDVPAGGRVAVTLWGQDSSGATKGRSSTTFGGMDLQLGKSSDAQIIFDSTRSVPANIGARVREHGNEEWGRIRWFSVPVVKLNPQYLGLPRSQPVYLGKYAAASTLASDFSVGTVSLKVPKQR